MTAQLKYVAALLEYFNRMPSDIGQAKFSQDHLQNGFPEILENLLGSYAPGNAKTCEIRSKLFT